MTCVTLPLERGRTKQAFQEETMRNESADHQPVKSPPESLHDLLAGPPGGAVPLAGTTI